MEIYDCFFRERGHTDLKRMSGWIVFLFILLAGCEGEDSAKVKDGNYTFETAKEHKDVIQLNGKLYQTAALETFISDFHKGEGGTVQIAAFNEKRKPVLYMLKVSEDRNPQELNVEINSSFTGSQEQFSADTCKGIRKEESGPLISYVLEGCGYGEPPKGEIVLLKGSKTK